MTTPWLSLLVVGCGCEETRFVGGTAAQRELARELVARFRRDALSFEVCEVELEAGEDPRHRMGSYDAVRRRIRVDPEPLGYPFEQVLRHELCHAVDDQRGISRYGDVVWPLDPDGEVYRNARPSQRDEEGFATWCELGPEALALTGRAEAQDLVAETFPTAPLPSVLGIRRGPQAVWTPPPGLEITGHEPLPRDDGAVELQLAGADGTELVAIDLETCSEVPAQAVWAREPADAQLPGAWRTAAHAVPWSGSGLLTTGWLALPDGSLSHPWFALVEDEWVRVDDGEPETAQLRGVLDGYGAEADAGQLACWSWVDPEQ